MLINCIQNGNQTSKYTVRKYSPYRMNTEILVLSWLFIDVKTHTYAYMSDVSESIFRLRLAVLLAWAVLPTSIFPLNSNKDILQVITKAHRLLPEDKLPYSK